MKRLNNCPYCSDKMEMEINHIECRKDDHTFIQSIDPETNIVYKITSRTGVGEQRYYIIIKYFAGYCIAWSGRFDSSDRIQLNYIPEIDFTEGMEAITNKIKVILTFN